MYHSEDWDVGCLNWQLLYTTTQDCNEDMDEQVKITSRVQIVNVYLTACVWTNHFKNSLIPFALTNFRRYVLAYVFSYYVSVLNIW